MTRKIGRMLLVTFCCALLFSLFVKGNIGWAEEAERRNEMLAPGVGHSAAPVGGTSSVVLPSAASEDVCKSQFTAADIASVQSDLRKVDFVRADDAVQEALIAYIKACRAGLVLDKPTNWLRAVAGNRLSNIRRDNLKMWERQRDAYELRNLFPGMTLPGVSSSDLYAIGKTLSTRSSRDELVALHGKYNDNLSAQEIADRACVKLTTIQGRIRRGECALADILKETLGDDAVDRRSLGSVEHHSEAEVLVGFVSLIIAFAVGIGMLALIGTAIGQSQSEDKPSASTKPRSAQQPNPRAQRPNPAAEVVYVHYEANRSNIYAMR